MITKLIYEAFDGKQFIEEEACLNYEEAHYQAQGRYSFYDDEGNAEDLDFAYFIFIENEAALERVIQLHKDAYLSTNGLKVGLNIFAEFCNESQVWFSPEEFKVACLKDHEYYKRMEVVANKIQQSIE